MQPVIYQEKDHTIDRSLLDREALLIIHRLRTAGYTAYLVGGSVRDLLLRQTPKDYDISTSARPEEIKRLFGRQCILIGRRFRLAHIRFGHKIFEVSTFRTGEMSEGLIIHDNEWGSEQEDVLRRDFTMNGLYYDSENHTVIDYVGGWQDIHDRIIRTIGDPEVRFKQDPVRMIRLLKFQARFGFSIAPDVNDALVQCRNEIVKSSPARILEEIFRMLESCAAAPFFKLLLRSGFITQLFPPLAAALQGPKGDEMLKYLEIVDQINKTASKYPIERPVLVSAMLFPVLEAEIEKEYLLKGTIPHLGQVLGTTGSLIHNLIIASFSHFPRRISSMMAYILSTQYRLTPPKERKQHPIRLFRIREFPQALRLLKIRAIIHPELQKTYLIWRESYRNYIRSEDGRAGHHRPHAAPGRHDPERNGPGRRLPPKDSRHASAH